MWRNYYLVFICSFFSIFRLQNLEEDLITKNIKLVIVDSIASLVRKEFDSRGSKNMIERTNLLAKEAAILKYVAEEFKIPVSMKLAQWGVNRNPSVDVVAALLTSTLWWKH